MSSQSPSSRIVPTEADVVSVMEVLPVGRDARSAAESLLQRAGGDPCRALDLHFSGDAGGGSDVRDDDADGSEPSSPAASLEVDDDSIEEAACASSALTKRGADSKPGSARTRVLASAYPSPTIAAGAGAKKRPRTHPATNWPTFSGSPVPSPYASSSKDGALSGPSNNTESQAPDGPLAERVRPKTLSEFVGQAAFHHESSLGRLLADDRFPSSVLWGPPGCGKTTVATIVAKHTKRKVARLSATQAGVKEVRSIVAEATRRRRLNPSAAGTLLFLDEIHRWNKAQQDALLPHVESGLVTLLGATTENPSFSLNKALLSRCKVVTMDGLGKESVVQILKGALANPASGLPKNVQVPDEILTGLAVMADGDARQALNALELAIDMSKDEVDENGADGASSSIVVSAAVVEKALQRTHLVYDRDGEEHYNIISALHKSMRASDVDASLYWLARMLESGENPLYVCRRLVRFASEDIGLADPNALLQATAAHGAAEKLGMPESDIVIAQAVVYCARAPKSVAVYRAYKAAKELVKKGPAEPVPLHIRNAPTGLMKSLGYGKEYIYPPDNGYKRGCHNSVSFFPDELKGTRFFDDKDVEPGHQLH